MDIPRSVANAPLSLLRELWPSSGELLTVIQSGLTPGDFEKVSSVLDSIFQEWSDLKPTPGDSSSWEDDSYYHNSLSTIFPEGWREAETEGQDILETRPLGVYGDRVTTDHISPTGAITPSSPAGKHLLENGVAQADLASFESRSGNVHVMTRGTFGNASLENLMTPGIAGGHTQFFGDAPVPSPNLEIIAAENAQPTFSYDAAIAYQQTGRKLIIIGGEDYGMGASRDWAAKGTALLGVKAVIAKSFEGTHRAHLIGMGILPLSFKNTEDYDQIKDMHSSTFSITGLAGQLKTRQEATLTTSCGLSLPVIARLDTPSEIDSYLSGGILPCILKQVLDVDESS